MCEMPLIWEEENSTDTTFFSFPTFSSEQSQVSVPNSRIILGEEPIWIGFI